MVFAQGNGCQLMIDRFAARRKEAETLYAERGWCMGPYDADPDNHARVWYGAFESWCPIMQTRHPRPEAEVAADVERRMVAWLDMGGV